MTNEERLNSALHELAQMFSQKRLAPVDMGQVAAARAVIDHCQWVQEHEQEKEQNRKMWAEREMSFSLAGLVGSTAGPSQFSETATGDRLKIHECKTSGCCQDQVGGQ
jgi:hypothetical protein